MNAVLNEAGMDVRAESIALPFINHTKRDKLMAINQGMQEILAGINNMEESRQGGWIHHSKLNISVHVLVELIDKKFIEPGGMYSRLTQHGRATLAVRED
ncbi:MAG: hypothetical protein ACXV74_11460 [Methylobacter sp.]